MGLNRKGKALMLEKVLGAEGSAAAVRVGRTSEGVDGECQRNTLSILSHL